MSDKPTTAEQQDPARPPFRKPFGSRNGRNGARDALQPLLDLRYVYNEPDASKDTRGQQALRKSGMTTRGDLSIGFKRPRLPAAPVTLRRVPKGRIRPCLNLRNGTTGLGLHWT